MLQSELKWQAYKSIQKSYMKNLNVKKVNKVSQKYLVYNISGYGRIKDI